VKGASSSASPGRRVRLAQLSELYRRLEDRLAQMPGVTGAGLALYNPLTNNWVKASSCKGTRRQARHGDGRVVGPCQRNYMQNFGMKMLRAARSHRVTTDGRRGRDRERGVRQALLLE